ncbi:MAG: hypothetical protein ND866_11020 [Pyrinomonadaceae bacterium]|nr:hypothetical protein [Pyrinomonadaceae bacterium]
MSTKFLSHSWGDMSGFAAPLAESLRLSVGHFLSGRGCASLFWSRSFGQISRFLLFVLIALGACLSQGCSQSGTNRSAGDSPTMQPSTSASPVPRTAFERDLQFIRNGQFTYVWVFSRQDGKPIDKDDAAYLRANAPQVVDWVTTDDGKRVIGGTNFDLEQGNMPQLRKRFVVEDYTGK